MGRTHNPNPCSAEGCDQPIGRGARGFCFLHYTRFMRRGDPNFEWFGTPAEKHARNTDKRGPDECWPWTGNSDKDGYGLIGYQRRNLRAHRVAYETETGEAIPAGLVVRHACDNPPCQNPRHLSLGTHADNIRDKIERGRQPRGEGKALAQFRRRLTDDQVAAIRAHGAPNFGDKARLAEAYGVSDEHIRRILNGTRR